MALTGPLPSATCTWRASPTHTLTVASVVNWPDSASSVMTRIDSTRNHDCSQPAARRMSSSSDASAASKW